jgi:cell division protein FtsI (penicillin-binding protein 3)
VTNPRSNRARIAISIVVVFAIVTVFVVRLVDIQIVRAAELNAASLDKRSVPLVTYGARGDIVDTNGVVLADSVERYDITVSPRVMLAPVQTPKAGDLTLLEKLAEIASVTGQDPNDLMTTLMKDPTSDFAYLTKGVTVDKLRAIKAFDIAGVYYELRPSRTYPLGAVAGNLVGFIGTDGPQAGLELKENECLAATNGSSVYEKSEDGVRLPDSTVTTVEAKNGGTLKLTIDSDLQWFVQQEINAKAQALGADWATAVVVRISDGHLMAVADYPSVDPNNVNLTPTDALGSRAFSTPYEPGSTFKAMTVASLLDAGVISQTTQVTAPGRFMFPNGEYIKDAWAHDDLHLTTAGVLTLSSNTGISVLSGALDAESRRNYMLKFGLNERTAVGFSGESGGYLPETAQWDQITNYAVQFGQGVQATAVQVASIYQTLGNGGVRMPLTLVEGCIAADGTVTDLPSTEGVRAVSEQAADQTVQMLEVVATQGGLKREVVIPGYRVGIKTGTAQVAENGRYGTDRVVSVAGLAPAENPQYAVIVTYGKPDTIKTSAAAAPSFKKIMTQVLKTFRVTPSTEPAPTIPVAW